LPTETTAGLKEHVSTAWIFGTDLENTDSRALRSLLRIHATLMMIANPTVSARNTASKLANHVKRQRTVAATSTTRIQPPMPMNSSATMLTSLSELHGAGQNHNKLGRDLPRRGEMTSHQNDSA
jgi:hypothetical protein